MPIWDLKHVIREKMQFEQDRKFAAHEHTTKLLKPVFLWLVSLVGNMFGKIATVVSKYHNLPVFDA